ncbi:hypothetical protein [Actinophytocola gossypii]|uniref:DUF3592 domain-containing protein n=1 Tax=Actinophytocola gossypii TaxID=2812003 RepID=A0ABT2J3L1_9PSEU|nr:hypothetical protein [Actinophytocola gossypii]MCT2582437.1 hypothetical protein [Actinophytocola gossypii]
MTRTDRGRARKPLRRTAWGLFLGGLLGLVLMVGAGFVASGGPPAGPGSEATWPAGETVAFYRVPLAENGDQGTTMYCRLTPDGEETRTDYDIPVHRRVTPDFSGDATITCDQEVTLVTGETRLTVSEVSRGPWLTLPLLAIVVGVLCFFPRFLLGWSRLANGRSPFGP